MHKDSSTRAQCVQCVRGMAGADKGQQTGAWCEFSCPVVSIADSVQECGMRRSRLPISKSGPTTPLSSQLLSTMRHRGANGSHWRRRGALDARTALKEDGSTLGPSSTKLGPDPKDWVEFGQIRHKFDRHCLTSAEVVRVRPNPAPNQKELSRDRPHLARIRAKVTATKRDPCRLK